MLEITTSRAYAPEEGARFYDALRQRVERIAGVEGVGMAELVPLTLSGRSRFILKEGQDPPTSGDRESIAVFTNNVSPAFLATLGIPLLAGRDFDARDHADRAQVAIINDLMARRYWPNEGYPLGRRFRTWDGMGGFGPWIEVIGVARTSKYVTLGEDPRPFFYRPLAQSFAPDVTLLIKTPMDPLAWVPTLRAELREFDPGLAVFSASPLRDQTKLSVMPVRVATSVAMTLGLIALGLGAIGIYGVAVYQVRQRTREIAIRVALGAEPSRVVALFTQRSGRWSLGGIGCGLAMSAVATSVLSTLLYGVNAIDPYAFVAVACLMATISYAAAWWPARSASRVNPMIALKSE